MIRPATLSDIPDIIRMGTEFMQTVEPYTIWTPQPAVLAETARTLITTPQQIILLAEMSGQVVGMLGAAIYRHPLSGEPTATEIMWWVSPAWRGGVGVRLFHAFEQWAGENGAVVVQMGAPSSTVERLYQRRGYTRMDVGYYKYLAICDRNHYTTEENIP